MHRLPAKGRCRILHEGDVVTELHSETAGRVDAGTCQQADDDLFGPMFFRLVVEVGVGKAALQPTGMYRAEQGQGTRE